MDFIVALPTTPEGSDALLTMADKFSKQNGFVMGKTTWEGADWSKSVVTFWMTAVINQKYRPLTWSGTPYRAYVLRIISRNRYQSIKQHKTARRRSEDLKVYIAIPCKRIHPWEIPKIHYKGKLEFENHSDIDMCYGQTGLQYANSGIRSEAEIEEKRQASQLARHHHQLQHGINKH